jgi:hypothetical protein
MVALNDVVRRHPLYAVSVLTLLLFSNNWMACTLSLCVVTYVLKWHSGTPWLFLLSCGVAFTAVEIVLVSTTARTMRYDYAIPELGVPLWLLPWWSVRSHWVLDLYRACGILQKRNGEKEGGSIV